MLKFLILQFLQGIKDSLSFKRILVYLISSKTLLNYFLGSLLVNGVIFTGLTLLISLIESWISSFPFLLRMTLTTIMNLLYIAVYFVSFIISSIWFNDIATSAIEIEKNILKNESFGKAVKLSFNAMMMNEVYRSLLVVFFTIQGTCLSVLPWIGPFISTLHVAFLYSFYCFEYKWGTNSYFSKSLAFFEINAAYFMGFGIVFASVINYLPFRLGLGVFSSLFPFFLLSAIPHSPPEVCNGSWSEGLKAIWKNTAPRLYINNFKFKRTIDERIGIFSWVKFNISFLNSFISNWFDRSASKDKVTKRKESE